MQKLLTARIAGVNRSHRLHHVVMTIHFVDECDSWFGILVRAGDDPVPNVGSEDHSRSRWLLDRALGKIRSLKRLSIAERHSRAISAPVQNIITIANRIEDLFVPGLAIELQLKPLVVIDGFQKLVSYVY